MKEDRGAADGGPLPAGGDAEPTDEGGAVGEAGAAGEAGAVAYTFVCRCCEARVEVNTEMRATLVSKGCVVCGADVGRTDFRATPG
jgi:hypothetical protein